MDGQSAVVIVNKPMISKPIHEMTDPRSGCAYHLCQISLTDPRKDKFGSTLLAKMGQQQEDPSQTFFAGVEKLVHEICFVADVAAKHVRDEQFRDLVFLVKYTHHHLFFDAVETAVIDRGRRGHAQRLARETSFAQEIAGTPRGDNRFPALSGYDRELHPTLSKIENGIRRLSLIEDAAVDAIFGSGFPLGDSSEQGFPIDRCAFLTWHDTLPIQKKSTPGLRQPNHRGA
jgi:hypothetical protein